MIEERNQEKRSTQKDHVNQEQDVIDLTSLHTNFDMQNFNLVFPEFKPTNSENRI